MPDEPEYETRRMDKTELALVVRMMREMRGWTQETLAELAGVSVRTVQRIEDGQGGSAHSLRALARAVEAEDIDFLIRPQPIPSEAGVRRQRESFDKEHLLLDARPIASGRALEAFMVGINMLACDDDEIGDENRDSLADAAQLFDYLSEYLDAKSEVSHQDRLAVADELETILDRLRQAGWSPVVATRETALMNDSWANKTPWPVKIGYLALRPTGQQTPKLAVLRRVRLE